MPTPLSLRVAGYPMEISADMPCTFWEALKYRYMPFAAACGSDKGLTIHIGTGCYVPGQDSEICTLPPKDEDDTEIRSLCRPDGSYVLEVRHPLCRAFNSWLIIDRTLRHAQILVDETGDTAIDSTTCNICIMMAYMLSAARDGAAIIHASCVVADGRAYLFIGRSGTGKSTHSRLWMANIPGTWLLNDDHPIVRVAPDGSAVAYGSPWSGKTDCYRNTSATVGAIVRLRQAPANRIRRIEGIEAFASLFSSFSCLPWFDASAESRHRAAESLAEHVPVYTMECLPDAEAALMCHAITNKGQGGGAAGSH